MSWASLLKTRIQISGRKKTNYTNKCTFPELLCKKPLNKTTGTIVSSCIIAMKAIESKAEHYWTFGVNFVTDNFFL